MSAAKNEPTKVEPADRPQVSHEAKAQEEHDARVRDQQIKAQEKSIREEAERKKTPVSFLGLYHCASTLDDWPDEVKEWAADIPYRLHALTLMKRHGMNSPSELPVLIEQVLEEIK